MKIRTALLSVFDKTGLADFARELHRRGIAILSTGGTAKTLRQAGVPITEVSEHTGSPEIMDGRVKTLHPKIHGGILAVRDNPEHRRQAEEQGIEFIDLVAVNLYPFQQVIAKPGVSLDEAIENIDIGGPSMVRSSAKNHRFVTIVTDPADYARVLDEMKESDGSVGDALRRSLAVKAFAHTSRYDAAIAGYLGGAGEFPALLALQFEKIADLRYGENPHQRAAAYRATARSGASVAHARLLGGKDLSYNNLLDLDSAFELAREFERPTCVVVKHNNPCGAASGKDAAEAFRGALEGDPVSAFGGIVAFNLPVDQSAAALIAARENFFEALVAPAVDPDAVRILRSLPKWGKNLRILEAGPDIGAPAKNPALRSLRDGLLVQSPDGDLWKEWKTATVEPTAEQKTALQFAWRVCKHVKSNAIVLAAGEKVAGVGAGQMSRLDSAALAVRKAGERAKGAVAASDAFFPFPDALETLLDAGVAAVVQPGGSVRDGEVLAAAKKRDVPMIITGMRHFRH
ncbi:MAG: bifunctional phosphoribosylaminoimidazolecarboxamide formyltransferase/IMP cyclohydrolase [Planctomycetes bacterium]|nr:bifunctional phosphoribosylaminoimidazolecarboxamide formyltransferase/IMP cyclohydrolase [Planctomycetota bacterium]